VPSRASATRPAGRILLHERDLAGQPPFRRNIGVVFQDYALFPHMTVAQNVGFGLRMRKRPRPEIDRRVEEMLELVRPGRSRNAARSS
jgi:ABC-type Fe3+/spermidine/putrescine transport system ATPase subunit